MSDVKKFIITTDVDTANQLKLLGVKLLHSNNDKFVFANVKNLSIINFSNIDSKKVILTNILHI